MKFLLQLLVFLIPVCMFSQDVFMQNGTFTQCSGVFYDSGGEFGNYDNDENFVITLCPQDVGDKMQLDFREFSTQFNVDLLTIYDGDDITAPSFGTFSGGVGPGLVQASDTNTSGCLTIQFISNGSSNGPGWEADIACARPCQTIVANLDSTIPALQPGNIVVADVNEVITFNGSATFSVGTGAAVYFWDFGDGNTATGQSVTHTYTMAGLYNVTLTVFDDNPAGCQSSNDIGLTAQIGGSNPGNPFVDAGPDITIDCADTCTTLNADFLEIGETNTYTVTQIPFVPPFPFQGLTNSVNTNIDDAWDDPQPLPLDFCFFGNIEPQFQVGSNGLIRFDVDPADIGGGSNAFNLMNDPLPNNTNDALGEGNVFTPVHDIDPAASSGEEIAWEIIGAPPNRVLAVSFYNVQMWSCSSAVATHMAVFYETTNVIDIYIQDAPFCSAFNNNKAVGIQNNAGTVAFVPPGRNTNEGGGWTTQDEAWRFTPAGPSIISFEWLDETNTVIGTTPTLNVCPTNDVTTYTARVTYNRCNGTSVTVNDTVVVTRDVPFSVDIGPDVEVCEGDPNVDLDADIGSTTATYQWLLNGTPIAGETNSTLSVASPNSGTYSVEVTDQSCTFVDDAIVTFHAIPLVNPISQFQSCDDTVIDGFTEFDLSTKVAEALGGQTDVNVSFHESQADADNDLNPLPNLFTNTTNPQIIYVRLENANNENCYVVTTFELLVSSGFNLDTPADLSLCDDLSEDGVEDFDFTQQTIDILAPYANVSLTYHLTQTDADNDAAPLPNPYQNITNPQTIFVRVEDDTNPLCFATTSFQIEVLGLPTLTPVTPLENCDDDTDGFVAFQLSLKTNEILGGQTDVDVSFHETFIGAETDSAEILDGYINTTPNNQTIFVRLEDTINGCVNVTTMDLVVLSNPLANQPTDFEVCDGDGDGFSVFALSTKTPEVDGGQPGVVVSYHLTPADAATGADALPDPYTNAVADTQEVYVRVEDTVTGCFSTTTLQLVVHPAPTTVATDDLVLCDDNNPGDLQEVFDLSVKDVELIDGQANVTVSYYPSQADADALTNEITAPYANTGSPQTIVAVLTDALTGCSSQIAFDLVVEALPTAIVPTPLEVCDDGTPDGITQIDLSLKDTEVSGGNGTYLVSYHETQLDADLGQNALPVPYTNLFNNQVVIVRVEDSSTGCHATVPLELVVEQAPVAFVPQPLVFCDPDSDGFGTFDLTLADAEITGGDATLGVTYHETQANADNGVDAIDTTVPYNNIVQDAQTLYARVESPTIATACATVVELELLVEPTPQLGEADPLEECDDASADGLAQFDLTAAAADILDGLDPAQYTLSYYESEAAADAGAPAIAVPTAYTNTVVGMQTVWVRVDDTATLGGCYKLAELELIVNPLPVLSVPPPLSLCDALTPGDEQEPFDLTDADAAILGGQTGIVLTYHETQADADAGTAAITVPYLNLSNAQTVYVRGEDEVTGCHSTVTLTLRVDPVPSPEPDPDPIEVCDDDNDGFAEFDLEIRTVEITNGEADVAITYHETLEEAQQGDNPILGLYTNIVPDSQQIYVRAENTLTGCFSLTLDTLELIVVPSPDVPEDLPPLLRCDDDDDGITQFDLTEMDALVLGGLDPAQVDLTYHIDPVDASTGANPIANVGNYTNTSNPQVIYVRLYDPLAGCLDTGEFELQVELPPVALQPSPLELCDDLGEPGDEVRVFDLTVKDTEITGGNPSWTVSYYETDADAQAQTGAIPDPTQYTNTSVGGLPANPQTLYVVVTDNDTGCIDFATLTLRVLPNPTPTPSDQLPDLELCDDVNVGDGVETFDLTENEALLLNGETGVTPTYHTSAADADSGANAIPDPTAHVNTASPVEIIYVRVENDVTGCYTVVEFSITVNPLPAAVAVTDFIQCELFTDGFAQFDLTLKDAEVLNGQDPSAYTVSYHESEADAQALDNAITGPYTNTSNPQTIYVAITDNVTGCSVSTQRFDIEVQEAAQANPIGGPLEYALCDDEVETDGDPSNDSVQFQLSTQNGEVLDLQDPADYAVSYYATLADAEFFVNPLPDLYENATNPQTIYVRVDNDTPDGTGQDTSTCFDITTMELRVDPLPVIVLEESYLLCVGTDGSEVVDIPVLDTGLSATDYTFVWSLDGEVLAGETGPSLVPQQGGSYSVLVEDIATGCFNEGITVVEESGPPDLEAELVSEAFTGSNVIEALATGIGVYEYSLDGGPWQDDGVFFDVRPGIRTVYARDINGCGVASVEVTVIDFPRFFTPNGDGNNDTWNIVGIGGQPNAKIYIFDRYGKLLKQLAPNGAGWDGTFNGNRMPTSDYWFTLTYEEPLTGQEREFKAHFTLKR